MSVKALIAILAAVSIVIAPSTSYALNANHFEPAPGDTKTVVVPTSTLLGEGNKSAHLFYSYASKVLEGIVAGEEADIVKRQHIAHISSTYGMREDLDVSVTVPYLMTQSSDMAEVPSRGLGDINLGARYRVPAEVEKLKLALAPHLRLDTGREEAFFGSGRLSPGFRFIADRPVNENITATANLGYEYQSRRSVAQIDINHSMLYGAGLVLDMPDTPMHFSGEIFGRTERFDSSKHSPAEALAAAGYKLDNMLLSGGLTFSLNDGYAAADLRGFAGVKVGF